MQLRDALVLGRVSNLPTVWTNMLAGIALVAIAGADSQVLSQIPTTVLFCLFIALTLFYVGGMYLNDAFDAEIDAKERSERPIPAGRVSRQLVFVLGFFMLAAGLVLLGLAASITGTGWQALAAGIALSGAIVLYNAYHKANPLSPFIMGVCRMMVYVAAGGVVAAELTQSLWLGAAISLGYLIGLTYVAKQENLGHISNMWPLAFLGAPLVYGALLAKDMPMLWFFAALLFAWILVALFYVRRRGPGDIPRAVVSLIAGISLLDAILIASTGSLTLAGVAIVGFGLTLVLQRYVPGT
jgi:hypothetical protein